MLVDVYTQEISRIKLKTDKQQKLLDKNYCTDNDIEFRFKDNLPEQTKVFN